ncbi:Uma2 family endonuclease [Pedobacter nototheniae]|uniref:Uma2 family endonuclease n=1 Tax=Pedobacter nototheniae TaxID=2488994 RepID=UPI002930F728|nr:Uma2 family endonuclease [Pedobacter nototheniae]
MSKPIPYPELQDEPIQKFEDIDASLTYSYGDYLKWLFDDRVELIKGKVFKMSPAPSRAHQEISGNIFIKIRNFLENHSCKVYNAPFDVRFSKESIADAAIYTVLQPDICVICDKSKLDERGCVGAPDLIVEILSPGNNKKELLYKYKIYEEFGVKEYWVVSQSDLTILIYTLKAGKFYPSKIFTLSEKITSSVLPGFEVLLDDIFAD